MSNSTCLAQSLRASYIPTNFALQLIKNRILSSPNPLLPAHPPFFPALPLSDGVGRTGTFICLHSQLERLKTEAVVDFLQAVKASRIQRPGLVPDVVCSALSPLSINGPPYTCSVSRAKNLQYTQAKCMGHKVWCLTYSRNIT